LQSIALPIGTRRTLLPNFEIRKYTDFIDFRQRLSYTRAYFSKLYISSRERERKEHVIQNFDTVDGVGILDYKPETIEQVIQQSQQQSQKNHLHKQSCNDPAKPSSSLE
jgi:hypothetical protein